jgi:hypothetical protein
MEGSWAAPPIANLNFKTCPCGCTYVIFANPLPLAGVYNSRNKVRRTPGSLIVTCTPRNNDGLGALFHPNVFRFFCECRSDT